MIKRLFVVFVFAVFLGVSITASHALMILWTKHVIETTLEACQARYDA